MSQSQVRCHLCSDKQNTNIEIPPQNLAIPDDIEQEIEQDIYLDIGQDIEQDIYLGI